MYKRPQHVVTLQGSWKLTTTPVSCSGTLQSPRAKTDNKFWRVEGQKVMDANVEMLMRNITEYFNSTVIAQD